MAANLGDICTLQRFEYSGSCMLIVIGVNSGLPLGLGTEYNSLAFSLSKFSPISTAMFGRPLYPHPLMMLQSIAVIFTGCSKVMSIFAGGSVYKLQANAPLGSSAFLLENGPHALNYA